MPHPARPTQHIPQSAWARCRWRTLLRSRSSSASSALHLAASIACACARALPRRRRTPAPGLYCPRAALSPPCQLNVRRLAWLRPPTRALCGPPIDRHVCMEAGAHRMHLGYRRADSRPLDVRDGAVRSCVACWSSDSAVTSRVFSSMSSLAICSVCSSSVRRCSICCTTTDADPPARGFGCLWAASSAAGSEAVRLCEAGSSLGASPAADVGESRRRCGTAGDPVGSSRGRPSGDGTCKRSRATPRAAAEVGADGRRPSRCAANDRGGPDERC